MDAMNLANASNRQAYMMQAKHMATAYCGVTMEPGKTRAARSLSREGKGSKRESKLVQLPFFLRVFKTSGLEFKQASLGSSLKTRFIAH